MKVIPGNKSVNKSEAKRLEKERAEIMSDLKKALLAEGNPESLTGLWQVQASICYSAFLTGKAVAVRMLLEGQISEADVLEVALSFAQAMTMKINIAPATPTPDTGGIVIARKGQGPPDING